MHVKMGCHLVLVQASEATDRLEPQPTLPSAERLQAEAETFLGSQDPAHPPSNPARDAGSSTTPLILDPFDVRPLSQLVSPDPRVQVRTCVLSVRCAMRLCYVTIVLELLLLLPM